MVADIAYLQQSQQEINQLEALFARQRAAYLAQPMPDATQRVQWLKALRELLFKEQQALIEAIDQDFSARSADETLLAEIMPSLHGIHYAAKRVKKWMRPARRAVGLQFQPASAQVVYQPLGVVGVIVPWNYPLFLHRPADRGPRRRQPGDDQDERIDPGHRAPAQGPAGADLPRGPGRRGARRGGRRRGLSKLPFDHLLFTGATSVGKHVMRAAAENLTPVTLELGGKSPAIVSDSVPMKDAAERIAFGKSLNAGQTCVAPDYVLVPSRRVEEFVSQYKEVVQGFFPRLPDNPDYTAIINERQLGRLRGYLDDAREKGATLVPLFAEGQQRRLPQTLLLNVSDDMKVMQEEIFGPLLPVIPYERLEDALAYVNQRPRPLALYYFGYDKAQQQRVLHETHSGGVCLNDTLLHVAQDDIPFGGVGPSGMGHYHGHEGFLTFSKAKGVFSKPRFNAARMIYPPYGKSIQKLVYKLFVR